MWQAMPKLEADEKVSLSECLKEKELLMLIKQPGLRSGKVSDISRFD